MMEPTVLSWNDVEAFNNGVRACIRLEMLDSCPLPTSSPRYEIWREGWRAWFKLMEADIKAREGARQ